MKSVRVNKRSVVLNVEALYSFFVHFDPALLGALARLLALGFDAMDAGVLPPNAGFDLDDWMDAHEALEIISELYDSPAWPPDDREDVRPVTVRPHAGTITIHALPHARSRDPGPKMRPVPVRLYARPHAAN